MLVCTRFAWAFADAMLLTTENEAMCTSSLKARPGILAGRGEASCPHPVVRQVIVGCQRVL